jgi:hypothetical protein
MRGVRWPPRSRRRADGPRPLGRRATAWSGAGTGAIVTRMPSNFGGIATGRPGFRSGAPLDRACSAGSPLNGILDQPLFQRLNIGLNAWEVRIDRGCTLKGRQRFPVLAQPNVAEAQA